MKPTLPQCHQLVNKPEGVERSAWERLARRLEEDLLREKNRGLVARCSTAWKTAVKCFREHRELMCRARIAVGILLIDGAHDPSVTFEKAWKRSLPVFECMHYCRAWEEAK